MLLLKKNMKKQIKVEQEGVRIIVDFKMVWAFMWRWIVIVLGTSFAIGLLVSLF